MICLSKVRTTCFIHDNNAVRVHKQVLLMIDWMIFAWSPKTHSMIKSQQYSTISSFYPSTSVVSPFNLSATMVLYSSVRNPKELRFREMKRPKNIRNLESDVSIANINGGETKVSTVRWIVNKYYSTVKIVIKDPLSNGNSASIHCIWKPLLLHYWNPYASLSTSRI